LPSTVSAVIAVSEMLYGAALSVSIWSVRSSRSWARASVGRLSFGAMYRSGPPPDAAWSSNVLNRLLKG